MKKFEVLELVIGGCDAEDCQCEHEVSEEGVLPHPHHHLHPAPVAEEVAPALDVL
jgi:hypothetical protein